MINTSSSLAAIHPLHETLCTKDPDKRKHFYKDLQIALKQKKVRSIIILGLDANAKTNYDPDTHQPNVLGHYTKGNQTNNNDGQRLLEEPHHKSNRLYPHKQ